jgi:hypothetical protein
LVSIASSIQIGGSSCVAVTLGSKPSDDNSCAFETAL